MFEYSDTVKEHFYHPRNVGELVSAQNDVATGMASTPDKTAVMQLHIQVDHSGKIIQAKFKSLGCPCCIATLSFITECLANKTIQQAKMITSQDLIQALALPRDKYYCALLGEDVIKAALKNLN